MGFSMPLPGLSPLRLLGGLFGLIALGIYTGVIQPHQVMRYGG